MLVQTTNSWGQAKFIPNVGQWNNNSLYQADIRGGRIFLERNMIRYNFIDERDIEPFHEDPMLGDFTIHGQAIFLQFLHASPNTVISAKNQYPEYYNFFLTHHESGWRGGVHAWSDLTYKNLYKNINLDVNGDGDLLKYNFEISPGGDPSAIAIKVSGANDVYIDSGDLHITSNINDIIEKAPYAYQWTGDARTTVACRFKVSGDRVSFVFPDGYDKHKKLVIDPVVIFASYSGSKADNFGFTGTYDSLGDGYSGGDAFAAGYVSTPGAWQVTFAGGRYASSSTQELDVLGFFARDVAFLKYTPDGKNLLYATYLGGAKANEQPHSMVVDKDNNLVILGTTGSSDFPVTKNAYDTTFNGYTDIFISRFSADGKKLLSSTLIGGSGYDGLNGIDTYTINRLTGNVNFTGQGKLGYNYRDQFRGEVIVDKNKNVYVATTTMSSDFPTTPGSLQPSFAGGTQDGCVFKMDSSLHTLVWSTYLGGSNEDAAYSLQIDRNDNVFVCGGTLSPYFFPKNNKYQEFLAGGIDGFICHIKNDGSKIISATYLGTFNYDQTYFVQLDASENVYVYGQTESKSFPIINAKYYNKHSGNFITKFDNGLDSIIYSTVFGSGKGKPDISPTAFLVDKCEKVYVSGWGGDLWPELSPMTKMYNMPISSDAFQKISKDSSDFYVAVFERNLDTLLYGSYFGGPRSEEHVDGGTSRFDKNGIIYQSVCGGCGGNSDFPTTPGAWSRTNNSPNCNNLLFKVDLKIPVLKASFIAPQFGCMNVTLKFVNTSTKAISYIWDFGDGSPTSADSQPQHFYQQPGNYTVTLVAVNPNSCLVEDTFKHKITIYSQAKADFNVTRDTCGLKIKFLQTGESNTTSWDFGDGAHSNSFNGVHLYASPGYYTIKLIADSGTRCVDTFSKTVNISGVKADFSFESEICKPQVIQFKNLTTGALESKKWYFPYASTDTATNPVFDFLKSGDYPVSLVVHDSLGCQDSVLKNVIIGGYPKAAVLANADTCAHKIDFINVSQGAKTFKWIIDDSVFAYSDTLTRSFPNDSMVKIQLIAEPGSACADTVASIVKFEHPQAAYSYHIDTCSGTVYFVNQSSGATHYAWQFTTADTSSALNPRHVFSQKGMYPVKLTVYSSAGCIDTAVKTVSINKDANTHITIPNVFTPDNDPYNNKFVVEGLSPCYDYDLSIYNRWGELMYHTSGQKLEWNGYFNNRLVPEGVYYYVFKGKIEGTLTGAVTVIY